VCKQNRSKHRTPIYTLSGGLAFRLQYTSVLHIYTLLGPGPAGAPATGNGFGAIWGVRGVISTLLGEDTDPVEMRERRASAWYCMQVEYMSEVQEVMQKAVHNHQVSSFTVWERRASAWYCMQVEYKRTCKRWHQVFGLCLLSR
jgi:hypothetical protein